MKTDNELLTEIANNTGKIRKYIEIGLIISGVFVLLGLMYALGLHKLI